MTDEIIQPEPPTSKNKSFPKIIWLLVAFIPGLVGVACLKINAPWLLYFLVTLDIACSVSASIGLVRGMKSREAQSALALLLTLFFLVANVFIVLFVGCSSMGRIAP